MSQETIDTSETSEKNSTGTRPPNTTEQTQSNVVNLCAVAIIACFFLPWIKFLGGIIVGTGLNIVTEPAFGIRGQIFAVIPLMALLTLFARAQSAKLQYVFGAATGILPIVSFVYFFIQDGVEFLQVLGSGAYLTLVLSLIIVGVSLEGSKR